jgi:hypothetical protein
MKTSSILFAAFSLILSTSTFGYANPSMLPKHPGYPMDKAVDPVKG